MTQFTWTTEILYIAGECISHNIILVLEYYSASKPPIKPQKSYSFPNVHKEINKNRDTFNTIHIPLKYKKQL